MAHSFGIIQEKNFLEKVQIPILNTLLYYLLEKFSSLQVSASFIGFFPQIHIFCLFFSLSSYCNQQSFFTSLKNNQFDTQKQELLCNSSEQLKMKERYSRKRSNLSMAFHQSEYICSPRKVHKSPAPSFRAWFSRNTSSSSLVELHFFFTFPSYFGMRYD